MDWLIYSDIQGWRSDNFLTVAKFRRQAEEKAEKYPGAIIENRRTKSKYRKSEKTGRFLTF